MSADIYFINLRRDQGRRRWSQDLFDFFQNNSEKVEWCDGEDCCQLDESGVILNWPTRFEGLEAAKRVKIRLFEKFLRESDSEYLVLFEDDVILHKDFKEKWPQILQFAKEKSFKLIYLGVSTVTRLDVNKEQLEIELLPQRNHVFSGAYGVLIHRNALELLVERYRKLNQTKLFHKPFDDYYLGHLQKKFPEECYLTNPQLVIPWVGKSNIRPGRSQSGLMRSCRWDPVHYLMPKSIRLLVITHPKNEHLLPKVHRSFQHLFPILELKIVAQKGCINPSLTKQALWFEETPEQIVLEQLKENKEIIITSAETAYLIKPEIDFLALLYRYKDRYQRIRFPVTQCPRCQNGQNKSRYLEYLSMMNQGVKTVKQECFYDLRRCLEIQSPEHQIQILDLIRDHQEESYRIAPFNMFLQSWYLGTTGMQLKELVPGEQIDKRRLRPVKCQLIKLGFKVTVDRTGITVSRDFSSLKRRFKGVDRLIRQFGDCRFATRLSFVGSRR